MIVDVWVSILYYVAFEITIFQLHIFKILYFHVYCISKLNMRSLMT